MKRESKRFVKIERRGFAVCESVRCFIKMKITVS